MRSCNETLANFTPNTGPTTATIDITLNWVDDAGTPHTDTRTAVTLPTFWALLTPAQQKEAWIEFMRRVDRLINGLDSL